MQKKEIKKLLRLLDEYKKDKSYDPFKEFNLYWASGAEYFLVWLLSKTKK